MARRVGRSPVARSDELWGRLCLTRHGVGAVMTPGHGRVAGVPAPRRVPPCWVRLGIGEGPGWHQTQMGAMAWHCTDSEKWVIGYQFVSASRRSGGRSSSPGHAILALGSPVSEMSH